MVEWSNEGEENNDNKRRKENGNRTRDKGNKKNGYPFIKHLIK